MNNLNGLELDFEHGNQKTNRLPKSPVLASLMIIIWLIFKPSIWRRYLATIDPKLSGDVALAELNFTHWQQPALRRLLLLGHGLWPIWVSLTTCLYLQFFQFPPETIILTSIYALLLSLIGGLLGSLLVSLVFGLIMSALGGFLLSLPVGWFGKISFSMAENIAIVIMLKFSQLPITHDEQAWVTVLLGILSAGIAGNLMYSCSIINKITVAHSFYRQFGSIVIGVVVSGLAVVLITGLTSLAAHAISKLIESGLLFTLAYDTLINGLFGVAIILIWFLHRGKLGSALLVGFGLGTLIGLFTLLKNHFHNDFSWSLIFNAIHGGIENALLYLILFAFPYVLAKRIANSWAGVVAGVFGSAGAFLAFHLMMMQNEVSPLILLWALLALVFGLGFIGWRLLFFYLFESAWNLLLFHADEKRTESPTSLIHWHAAFWDEYQRLPFVGLDYYLVMVTERNPDEGKVVLEFISNSQQSWAAQAAQIELDARSLQNNIEVQAIGKAHRGLAAGELSGPASALLRSFSRISRDIEAALAQESRYNQRLALDGVEERLDGLIRELTRSSEVYARRFRPIAIQWRQIVADYIRTLNEAVESRQEISNPYVIGIPLTEHQEIFVGRSDISEQIEHLLLETRCPPLLLYGQRRTGKTSLLNNLGKLLPWHFIPLFVDLQGPTSLAKDTAGFLYNLSRAIQISAKRHRQLKLPQLPREQLAIDPFTSFDEWLDEVELKLDSQQMLLLTLDEFSALEHIFNKGLLDEESILGLFRHIIQHRARLKILLSGSNTIDEFERWASYLINVQTVHISYLQASEALQLIEQPVKDFALAYQENAIQRVMELTRCHPALIQLLCAEIVTIKNRQNIQERRLANLNDVEAAIPGALQHGRFFFADIANNQVSKEGLILLRYLANQGEGAIISDDELLAQCQLSPAEYEAALAHLLQRELVELLGDGYHFQVELIRRWFV